VRGVSAIIITALPKREICERCVMVRNACESSRMLHNETRFTVKLLLINRLCNAAAFARNYLSHTTRYPEIKALRAATKRTPFTPAGNNIRERFLIKRNLTFASPPSPRENRYLPARGQSGWNIHSERTSNDVAIPFERTRLFVHENFLYFIPACFTSQVAVN